MIYTQRGYFFLPRIFFLGPGDVNACTPMQAVSSETPLIGCVSLARPPILCTLSISDRVVITWSPSGYTPVGPDCPDALSSHRLQITTWQLVKTHGVTRNEPKMHVICYITFVSEKKNRVRLYLCMYCITFVIDHITVYNMIPEVVEPSISFQTFLYRHLKLS